MRIEFQGRRAIAAIAWVFALAGLSGCSAGAPTAEETSTHIDVSLIAFNDLHGNLEPPHLTVAASGPGGTTLSVPAGGAAYLASAIASLKASNPNHAVVSAGDMIGASPLVSALFLDEPTIEAVNAMAIDFNAVGNHEFDKGQAELMRMKEGGCARYTALQPCRVNPDFPGANFGFLAANTLRSDGSTLFPATGIKRFTQGGATVTVGFIGLTLRNTPSLVTPTGVAGLHFADEAQTVNAQIAPLRAAGANAIVVLIHEGGTTTGGYNDKHCPGLRGDILPILSQLSPEVDVVVSGHTHQAYVCELELAMAGPSRRLLLTSAGQYGSLLTHVRLSIDTRSGRVARKSADNLIVQGEAFERAGRTVALRDEFPVFPKDPTVAALIDRYAIAAAPLAQRVVGRIGGALTRQPSVSRENTLGNLIADAQLAATRAPDKGGAQISFMNPGGVRADLIPAADGSVRYGQLFSVQPFGNSLVVKTLTGAQIRQVLEQQFASGTNTVATPRVLFPSAGFSYRYDLSQPAGARVSNLKLHGADLVDGARYRVTMSSFLAAGGDNFSVFLDGTEALGGGQDVDALEAYIQRNDRLPPPAVDRIAVQASPGA